jgi:hypothetical protein
VETDNLPVIVRAEWHGTIRQARGRMQMATINTIEFMDLSQIGTTLAFWQICYGMQLFQLVCMRQGQSIVKALGYEQRKGAGWNRRSRQT